MGRDGGPDIPLYDLVLSVSLCNLVCRMYMISNPSSNVYSTRHQIGWSKILWQMCSGRTNEGLTRQALSHWSTIASQIRPRLPDRHARDRWIAWQLRVIRVHWLSSLAMYCLVVFITPSPYLFLITSAQPSDSIARRTLGSSINVSLAVPLPSRVRVEESLPARTTAELEKRVRLWTSAEYTACARRDIHVMAFDSSPSVLAS